MNKLSTFRAALLAGVPELGTSPEKLSIMAENGRTEAYPGSPGQAGSISWMYCYQLTCIVQDFAGDMDLLTSTVLTWIAQEQPSLLQEADPERRGFRFAVEQISAELVDLQIDMQLQEAVTSADGATFTHPAEPPADPSGLW